QISRKPNRMRCSTMQITLFEEMKFPIPTLLITFLSILPSLMAEIPTEAIDPRFIELIAKQSLGAEDVQWLEKIKNKNEITECIATALLYKHDSEKHLDAFHQYFRIDKSHKSTPQTAEVINDSVNGIIKNSRERTPLETATRIYLHFRGTHYTFPANDGSKKHLEMMFRASVFQGIFNASQEEVLKQSAIADFGEMNSNKSE
ncbi:MAG: hypothetical protein NWR36_09460, partial [Opitutales bacterium]|nr:hypothetical protein [Opitutales bacterium]